MTRYESEGLEEDPPMPELLDGGYLLDWLLEEIGPVGSDGNALCWPDLEAYDRMAGWAMTPWEAATLRALSTGYVQMLHEAAEPGCPPPWVPDADE